MDEQPSQSKIDVFISYTNAEREAAKHLADALRDKGVNVWDDTSIPAGTRWKEEIQKAIESSDAVIMLTSPNAHGLRNEYKGGLFFPRDTIQDQFIESVKETRRRL